MAQQMTQNGKYLLATKQLNFSGDAFKIILMQPGFVFSPTAHNVYTDISASELPTANGYTIGGLTLSSVAVTRDDAHNRITVSWGNATFTATGGTISAGGACIIDTSITNSPVIAEIDAGGTITAVDGTPLVAASILLQIT